MPVRAFLRMICLSITLICVFSVSAQAAPYCTVKKRCAYLTIDAESGATLESLDPDKRVHPASLTKLMTVYMLFEALERKQLALSDRLYVSRHAAEQPALKLGLRAGQTIMLEDALEAITVKSANDAAVVVAEAIAGTESAFAQRMTRRAHELGMNRTTFRNASGLPDVGQVTTARDMTDLAKHVLTDFPRYRKYFHLTAARIGGELIEGHNNLVKNGTISGGKTGYIRDSGFNMVAWSERDGRLILSAIFGGRTAAVRDSKLSSLLQTSYVKARKLAPAQNAHNLVPLPRAKPQSLDDLISADVTTKALTTAKAAPDGIEEEDINTLIVASNSFATSWAIQIGAYKDEVQARQALQAATRQAPSLLGAAYPRTIATQTTVGQLHRAQLIGLDEQQAKAACAQLTKSGQQCLPMPPSS